MGKRVRLDLEGHTLYMYELKDLNKLQEVKRSKGFRNQTGDKETGGVFSGPRALPV